MLTRSLTKRYDIRFFNCVIWTCHVAHINHDALTELAQQRVAILCVHKCAYKQTARMHICVCTWVDSARILQNKEEEEGGGGATKTTTTTTYAYTLALFLSVRSFLCLLFLV